MTTLLAWSFVGFGCSVWAGVIWATFAHGAECREQAEKPPVDHDWHRCAWCEEETWFNARTGTHCITRPPDAPEETSHGLCGDCAKQALEELR